VEPRTILSPPILREKFSSCSRSISDFCAHSPENLRRSVDAINATLAGHKKLDLFEPARLDPKYTVEEVVETLAGLVKEGKFDYIGLSEVSAATVRKAHAVSRFFLPSEVCV
jgi:aryl-alcohol dehydrogenase-like predicted oxidoreductase